VAAGSAPRHEASHERRQSRSSPPWRTHDRVLELALSSTVWPFTEPASRRIQIGADGAADPEIEGAWVVRVLIRGLQPGSEERACARLPLPSARAGA
jgi:hypothetical protein